MARLRPASHRASSMVACAVVAFAALAPAVVRAQFARVPVDTAAYARMCDAAARDVARAGLAPAAPGWARLAGCPAAAAPLVAGLLRRERLAEDTAPLRQVLRVGPHVRDSALFEAALETAADRGAGVAARAVGFVVLFHQLAGAPRALLYADVVAYGAGPLGPTVDSVAAGVSRGTLRVCTGGPLTDAPGAPTVRPLPADAWSRAATLVGAVRNDARAPRLVRAAAWCASEVLGAPR